MEKYVLHYYRIESNDQIPPLCPHLKTNVTYSRDNNNNKNQKQPKQAKAQAVRSD
jgi:hypothetical protein